MWSLTQTMRVSMSSAASVGFSLEIEDVANGVKAWTQAKIRSGRSTQSLADDCLNARPLTHIVSLAAEWRRELQLPQPAASLRHQPRQPRSKTNKSTSSVASLGIGGAAGVIFVRVLQRTKPRAERRSCSKTFCLLATRLTRLPQDLSPFSCIG